MRFLFVLSGCLTVLVVWGMVREVNYRLSKLAWSEDVVEKTLPKAEPVEQVVVGKLDKNTRKAKHELNQLKSFEGSSNVQLGSKFKDDSYFAHLPQYSLGPRVSDWDRKRESFLKKNVRRRENLYLVSGSQPSPCAGRTGDHYLLKSLKNKVDYCRLHGIQMQFYNMADLDPDLQTFWVKLPLIRMLMLKNPQVEWMMWMDSDALFTDMSFEIPLDRYKRYNFVAHGWDELVYDKKLWLGLNAGIYLIRNCQWTLNLMDEWSRLAPSNLATESGNFLSSRLAGRPKANADDQSALVYILASQKSRWADKVYLEKSYYLNGYWRILVDNFENLVKKFHPGLGDERWPFVTHFSGCQPCSGTANGSDSSAMCLKGMERAFNFADNQVLQLYGYKHVTLESSAVTHLRSRRSGRGY